MTTPQAIKQMALKDLGYTGVSTFPGATPAHVYQDHMSKYAFAAQFVSGQEVLDIGCASGMGVELFTRNNCKHVVGVELNPETLWFNPSRYTSQNAMLAQADACRLPIGTQSVDTVVMLEVIEHIENDRQTIAEIARVLRPGGRFICSTPNFIVSRNINPFHVREYLFEQFQSLLSEHTAHIEWYGQSFVLPHKLLTDQIKQSLFTTARKVATGIGLRTLLGQWRRSLASQEPTISDETIDTSKLDPRYAITTYDPTGKVIPAYFVAVCQF